MAYESFSQYLFPASNILYEDLPTIPNSQGSPIIDVEAYYTNEQDFIRKTLNNAFSRIIQDELEGKISEEGRRNEFKAKVYEAFFSQRNHTFAFLVRCK